MDDDRVFASIPYRPEHREAVRKLCCDTGFLGQPIDPVFEDRDLFADYLTRYYTDWEPQSSFVLTVDGEVRGYLLGSRFPKRQAAFNALFAPVLACKILFRLPRYSARSRRFVNWILTRAAKECPPKPKGLPHFHINLVPEARRVATTRILMESYLRYLRDCGETGVYGQMVVFGDRRGTALFERYGFKVLNRSEITKYRDLHPERVYLCTVVRDLAESARLVKTAA